MKVNEIVKTLHIDIKNTSYIYDCKVIDGYTDRLKCVVIGDTKYNIQLAQYKDYVLIGYPLIMQGF